MQAGERERERRSKNAAAAAAAAATVECKPLSFSSQKRKRTLTLSFSVPNSDARCSAMVGEKGDDQEWTLRSKPSLFEEDFCEESFRESELPFFSSLSRLARCTVSLLLLPFLSSLTKEKHTPILTMAGEHHYVKSQRHPVLEAGYKVRAE